jgi:hypothetical protein
MEHNSLSDENQRPKAARGKDSLRTCAQIKPTATMGI